MPRTDERYRVTSPSGSGTLIGAGLEGFRLRGTLRLPPHRRCRATPTVTADWLDARTREAVTAGRRTVTLP